MILNEQDCVKLFDDLQSGLTWRWDSRFKMAIAEISSDDTDAVGKILENHLGVPWNAANVNTASQTVHKILAPLGGMMQNQLLYVAGLPQEGHIFCAWWPWGNGLTISIRIGINQKASILLTKLVPLAAR